MTSQQQRLEELKQRAKELAERVDQLEDQLNNVLPITGLLGRWATNRDGKQVLIIADRPMGGWVETAYVNPDGTTRETAEQLDDLTFPEQTTRPQDVPVGEAWLVNACDGVYVKKNAVALKADRNLWVTGSADDGSAETRWGNDETELIAPLIPAHPHDTPETATTEEEYAALPEGTIVAGPGCAPWVRREDVWVHHGCLRTTDEMPIITRHVLRRGWGTSPANP